MKTLLLTLVPIIALSAGSLLSNLSQQTDSPQTGQENKTIHAGQTGRIAKRARRTGL